MGKYDMFLRLGSRKVRINPGIIKGLNKCIIMNLNL